MPSGRRRPIAGSGAPLAGRGEVQWRKRRGGGGEGGGKRRWMRRRSRGGRGGAGAGDD